MRRLHLLAMLTAAAAGLSCKPAPEPQRTPVAAVVDAAAPAPTPTRLERSVLLSGALPPELGETSLLNEKCQVCHSLQYLTQQRLTRPQWQKTIDKMRKFGASVSDEESARIVAFAAANFTRDLTPITFALVSPPPGALP